MNPSSPFIRRPVMTTLVFIALALFGYIAYRALPVSDLPNVEFPTISVSISYPGADPVTIANNVISPLESEFMSIEGIENISSSSVTGSGTIAIQFSLNRSIDSCATDVLSGINAASAQLPQDLPYTPTYEKTNPTATPILFYALSSDTMTQDELYKYAHNFIGQRLNIIEGVSQVDVFGSPYAIRIQVDPQKLAARGIGIDEFANAVKAANVRLPTGKLYGSEIAFTISCQGQMLKAEDYRNLIIKNQEGLITRLSDVAEAFDSLWNDKYYIQFTNKKISQPMVGMALVKQPGANALDVIKRVNEKLPDLLRDTPRGIHFSKVYDQSEFIQEGVHDVKLTLMVTICLVILVIFIFLGKIIDTVIPTMAIPASLLGTFILMRLLGFNLDLLSLLAITLAVGFLVDDAIVVLENIARHVELGATSYQASIDGSRQISLTILSMTICLCCIFIPVIFMEGIIGRILREFGLTIVIAVLLSGIVSLTFTPMLCSRFVATYTHDKKKTKMEHISEWINQKLIHFYKPTLEWCLKFKLFVLIFALFSLGLTLFLLSTLPKDFIPNDDIGFVIAYAQARDGTSPFKTAALTKEVEKVAIHNPYVDSIVALGALSKDNQSVFYIRLIDIHKRPSMNKVIDILHTQFSEKILGAQVYLKAMPLINLEVGSEAAKGAYQYTVQSLSNENLFAAAQTFEKKLQTLPQINRISTDLEISQPQLDIQIQRDKASFYNINAGQIETVLNLAYAGSNLTPINFPDNQYYVIMETLPKFYKDPKMLSQLWLRSGNNSLIPFDEIVTLTEKVGPMTIHHLNGLPSVTFNFNVAEGVALDTALKSVEKAAKTTLPTTVFGSIQGAANVFRQAFAHLNFLLLITIFVVYIILGILYENFFHPFTVMSTLPPAALGGLLTLLAFGYSLSLYAFVGIIMLLGIVMKNGIILVDFANEAIEKDKLSAHEAIMTACLKRFRPILMTTCAALMGALPIALGVGGMTAQSRRPLGAAIVGGLIFSQILTLYLTPVTFVYLELLREWIHRKKKPKNSFF